MTSPAPSPTAPRHEWTGALLLVLVVTFLAGSVFGYDQGVISGALAGLQRALSLTPFEVEIVTSWVTLGALAGSLAGGEVADRAGRRRSLIAAGVLFTLGAGIEALAPNVGMLVVGRLVVGVGVGIAAVAAPLYAAEIAPAAHRGRFISTYQLAITVGIFLSYLVDQLLAEDESWRAMLGASAVPAALLVVALLGAVESPRWLLRAGRADEARASIVRTQPGVDATQEIAALQASLRAEPAAAAWREIFAPAWRRPLVIGVGLAIFQQVTGINAIIYYANHIFAAAGFVTAQQQTVATTWGIGAVNVVATFIAIACIDRAGRRPLLIAGFAGMCASLAAVAVAFHSIERTSGGAGSTLGIVTLAALVVFIVSFAFSLGPVTWTVINEIYPARIRGRAVAFATAVNWGAAFVVSQFFLTLVKGIGEPATFGLFAACCVAGGIWVWRAVPETRGKSLEEIERLWGAPGSPANAAGRR